MKTDGGSREAGESVDRSNAGGRTVNVAVFRPADDRLVHAVDLLEQLGVEPVADPLLAIEPTGDLPPVDADVVVLTSRTGADIIASAGWEPQPETTLAAIGETTAEALRGHGYEVAIVPAEYSSAGLVASLRGTVDGATVDVARSDHGSPILLEGLRAAGAAVHETVLYELTRPAAAGTSVPLLAAGEIDAVLFTSSLTVEHLLASAAEMGRTDAVHTGLDAAVVGAIGEPTRETAAANGIAVDVVAPAADFDALARAVVNELCPDRSGTPGDVG